MTPEYNIDNYTSKLELGVLGVLWCEGSHEDKVKFYGKLINPYNDDIIQNANKELKFTFCQLFFFSQDLPEKLSDQFVT